LSGYKLTGANGDEITFDNSTYVLNPALTGFGIPPTSVRIDESARDGGTYRYTRRAVRNIDMPVTVLGTSATDVETKLRRLARLTQDTLGPTTLTALRDAGDLTMDLHYTGGAELEYGGDAGGLTWARLLLSFQAPQPYWQTADPQTFQLTSGDTGRGLLPELTKLKVSSSQSLGTITITNTGDVPVYPTWTIQGPIDGFVASRGALSFGFNTALTADDAIIVNTELGTVVDDTGVNRYDILNPAPKFFSFPPGTFSAQVTGTGTTSATFVSVFYNQRFEVVHG
jgi:hypothetical protein